MLKLISILLLLPTLSFAAARNCHTLPSTQACDNWMLNGASQPKADLTECLVEERNCRSNNGCGVLISSTTEKQLSTTCSVTLSKPAPPTLSKFSPAD
ncbi:MAG: hypothetical protein ABL930_08545 [Pseudobdellovibrio sp.]